MCVVDDNRVMIPIIRWLCKWVISKLSQHEGNLDHIPHHVPRDVAGPLGECFQVHVFDYLVCGSLDLGQGDAPELANEVLMVNYCATLDDALEVHDALE